MGFQKDLTGQVFKRLTVLGFSHNDSGYRSYWTCRCECGKVKPIQGYWLKTALSCGCYLSEYEDLTGKRYGRWTILSRAGNRKKLVYWNAVCDCGNKGIVGATSLSRGHSKSCGCFQREVASRIHRLDGFDAVTREAIGRYKQGAKSRGYEWSFEDSYAASLMALSCHYCGVEHSMKGRVRNGRRGIMINGLDRKNNDLGYTIENVVPCCKTCNRSKVAMGEFEFLAWIRKVYDFRKLEAKLDVV